MKRVLFVFGVLFSFGMLSACSSSDEIDSASSGGLVDLLPIDENNGIDAVSDFFETTLYSDGEKPFDFKSNMGNEENPCVVINNEKEFEDVYTGDSHLPIIDFSKYTLVIGKVYCVYAGTFIDNMSLRIIDHAKAILFINCISDTKGCYVGIVKYAYYWKLFPKFDVSKVDIKISKKFGEIDDSKKR